MMFSHPVKVRGQELRAELISELEGSGVLPDRLKDTFSLVPRHWFMPDTFWSPYCGEPFHRFCRGEDREGWLRAVYRDESAVAQWAGGHRSEPDEHYLVTSSATRPSVVARMLMDLELEEGNHVLELGSGTGWSAALMQHHIGDGAVLSVEVDQGLSQQAGSNASKSRTIGAQFVVGDGARGWPARAPYDRVVSTYAVRKVPQAWLDQTSPGGVILTPWASSWISNGMLKLRAAADGTCQGRFVPYGSFMTARGEPVSAPGQVTSPPDAGADRSVTGLDIWSVIDSPQERFALGALVPGVGYSRDPNCGEAGVIARVWLFTADWSSWAAVDWSGDMTQTDFAARQFGPRRLLDEVACADAWFRAQGSPVLGRYGMTVTADCEQLLWLDDPDNLLPSNRRGEL